MNKIKPGDIVTLNREGQEELEAGCCPFVIRELYRNVAEGGGRVIRVSDRMVRLSIINNAFPAGPGIENNFGIPQCCLKALSPKEDV